MNQGDFVFDYRQAAGVMLASLFSATSIALALSYGLQREGLSIAPSVILWMVWSSFMFLALPTAVCFVLMCRSKSFYYQVLDEYPSYQGQLLRTVQIIRYMDGREMWRYRVFD